MESETERGAAVEEVVEGHVTEIPTENKTGLPVPARDFVVKAVMSIDEVKRQWQEYQRMEREVLQDDDYTWYVTWRDTGRDNSAPFQTKADAEAFIKYDLGAKLAIDGKLTGRKKKSAYRKMQRFFGLSLPTRSGLATVEIKELGKNHFVKVEKSEDVTLITYLDAHMGTVRVDSTVVVRAPSGASMTGVGACSTSERGFKHPDHDIAATAFTRSLNRAISDLVGWGDVSAEEIEAPETTWPEPKISKAQGEPTQESEEVEEKATAKLRSLAELFAALNEKNWAVAELMNVVGDLSKVEDFDAALAKFTEFKEKQES